MNKNTTFYLATIDVAGYELGAVSLTEKGAIAAVGRRYKQWKRNNPYLDMTWPEYSEYAGVRVTALKLDKATEI